MFKNTFFYRTPAVAASGDGSFIFSKFRRHVFFNKIEHHSPGIFATVLKKLYSRNAFRGTHTFGGVRKIAPRSGSGFGLGLALELGLGGGGNFPRTTFRECLSMATCWKIENHFHFLKEKKKRKSVIKIFQFCYCGQISCFKFQTCFHWEVLKHETKAMLTWVRSKLTVY